MGISFRTIPHLMVQTPSTKDALFTSSTVQEKKPNINVKNARCPSASFLVSRTYTLKKTFKDYIIFWCICKFVHFFLIEVQNK